MDDKQLRKIAKRVAGMAYEYASPSTGAERWLEDRRKEEVNPLDNQTKSGLFLSLYYGEPGSIYTPWGEWNCWGSGSGSWNEVMPKFLQSLGAFEAIPLKRTDIGEFGPVYAITSVDGISLPEAVLRDKGDYLEYDEAIRLWKSL